MKKVIEGTIKDLEIRFVYDYGDLRYAHLTIGEFDVVDGDYDFNKFLKREVKITIEVKDDHTG